MNNKERNFFTYVIFTLILLTACGKKSDKNVPDHIYPEIQGSVVQVNVNGNYIAEVKGSEGYISPPTSTYCYGNGGVIIGVIEDGGFEEKASFSFEANKDESDNVFCLPVLRVRNSSAFMFPEGVTVTQGPSK